jgi:hypothetical protein
MVILGLLAFFLVLGWWASRPEGPRWFDKDVYVAGDPAETERRLTEAKRAFRRSQR